MDLDTWAARGVRYVQQPVLYVVFAEVHVQQHGHCIIHSSLLTLPFNLRKDAILGGSNDRQDLPTKVSHDLTRCQPRSLLVDLGQLLGHYKVTYKVPDWYQEPTGGTYLYIV